MQSRYAVTLSWEADGLDKRIIIRIQCIIFVRIGCFHTNRPVEHISEDRQGILFRVEGRNSGLDHIIRLIVQHIEVVIHIRQETQRLAVLELRDEKMLRI